MGLNWFVHVFDRSLFIPTAFQVKKNIDMIIKEYDSSTSLPERRKKLREKIDSDIVKFKQSILTKAATANDK